MRDYQTKQESFWAGQFGNEYTERNQGEEQLAASTAMFASIVAKTEGIKSVLEIGANRGINLLALKHLLPGANFSAVEINKVAAGILKKLGFIKVYHTSVLEFEPDYQRDLVFSCGVLIHINPDMLNKVYQALYQSSRRYICIAEYYNPFPVEVDYRGESGKLFKRDFAGDMLDTFNDLSLIDYGFTYHRDSNFLYDDINWFLLEKKKI